MLFVSFVSYVCVSCIVLFNKESLKSADLSCELFVFSEFWLRNLHIRYKSTIFSMGDIFSIYFLL